MSKEDLETEAFRKGKKNATCKNREVRPIRTGHQIKNKFLKAKKTHKNHQATKFTLLCSWWKKKTIFSHNYLIHKGHDLPSGIHIVKIRIKLFLLGNPGLQEIFKILLFEGPDPDWPYYVLIVSGWQVVSYIAIRTKCQFLFLQCNRELSKQTKTKVRQLLT